jgi:hypothetical protein
MARVPDGAERHDRVKEAAMGARPIDSERTGSSERALRVERGRVMCPRRGVVDIEQCWVCREYQGMSDAHVESLICGLSDEALESGLWAVDHEGSGAGGGHA